MNLDDIRMFLCIARADSLTSAARTLYVSQPALSKRLARLETELGASLFQRGQGTHRMELTPAGRMLLPFAEKWEDLHQEVSMLHDLNSRVHYFVACVGTIGEYVMADTLYRFHQLNPEVELVVQTHHSRECYGSIHERTADIAFVVQESFYQNILTTPLFQEEMKLIVSASSGLKGKTDPRQLDPAGEIVIPWNTEFMRWRQNSLRITRHPIVTLSGLPMALPYLRNSSSWIIVPQTVADQAMQSCPDLRCLPLTDPPPDRIVYWIEEYGRHHENSDGLLKILRQTLVGREGIHWL